MKHSFISGLLRTHRSPFPLFQRQSKNYVLAQDAVNTISSRGAFFQEHVWEDHNFVIASIDASQTPP